MTAVIGRFSSHTFAVFRIIAGLMFAIHGSQKLFAFPGGQGPKGPLPPMMMAAGVIELAGGLLVAVGLLTGYAAFIASGEMAFAYFMAHASKGWNPVANKGELPVLYCFAFLYIAAHGAGIWSLDAALRGHAPVRATSSTGEVRP